MKQLKYTQFAVMVVLAIVGITALFGIKNNPFQILIAAGCLGIVWAAYTSKW